MEESLYKKPSLIHYSIFKLGSRLISKSFFKCKVLRNEAKKEKGPFVIIANHECSLDFANIIPYIKKRLTFVMSKAYHDTMKLYGFMKNLHAIYKNQFMTSTQDIKSMFNVIRHKGALLLFPAGLMTDNGTNTYVPKSTFKFLKKLGTKVFVAKTQNTYFVKPKWGKGIRNGKSTIDIYKLYDEETIKDVSVEQIEKDVTSALSFDAYRENEKLGYSSKKWQNVEGLHNVLYRCPYCNKEFTVKSDKNMLFCESCGYSVTADKMGLLSGKNAVFKYPSDWAEFVYVEQVKEIESKPDYSLSEKVVIRLIDKNKHKFFDVGNGVLVLNKNGFTLSGEINGEKCEKHFDIVSPITPFIPGKQLDLQEDFNTIVRCVFENGSMVSKYILTLKYFFEKLSTND